MYLFSVLLFPSAAFYFMNKVREILQDLSSGSAGKSCGTYAVKGVEKRVWLKF